MPHAVWESRIIADGGRTCRYCGRGCKCGRCVVSEGTCVYCGHGMAMEIGEAVALHPYSRWTTQKSMERAVRVWVRNLGFPPKAQDWKQATHEHPSYSQVVRLFGPGGWKKLLVAAGCTPPAQGRPPRMLAA